MTGLLYGGAVFWTVSIVVALIVVFLVVLTIRAHQKRVTTGNEGLVGARGTYKGNGQVQVHGELWRTSSGDTLQPGDRVIVTGVNGLLITVEKT